MLPSCTATNCFTEIVLLLEDVLGSADQPNILIGVVTAWACGFVSSRKRMKSELSVFPFRPYTMRDRGCLIECLVSESVVFGD